MDKHLFLFGGGPPFPPKLAERFSQLAKKKEGAVSILCLEREGWIDYMPNYTKALEENGITIFRYLPLPTTSESEVIERLHESTGVIIGGGDTSRYADYIVDTPISDAIRTSYIQGVPVAGFSAGALISPKRCVISPKDNVDKQLQIRKGLGLIEDLVIAVHFSEWGEEGHLRNTANKLRGYQYFGIDEMNGMYFVNERLEEIDGSGVYRLEEEKLVNISTIEKR